MSISPTQRSLKKLRDEGWTVAITEHWLHLEWHPAKGIRKDLFGFGDLLALKEGEPVLIVQTTSGANTSARMKKIEGIPEAHLAIKCGVRVVVHGWRKLKPRDQKVARWNCKEDWFEGEKVTK